MAPALPHLWVLRMGIALLAAEHVAACAAQDGWNAVADFVAGAAGQRQLRRLEEGCQCKMYRCRSTVDGSEHVYDPSHFLTVPQQECVLSHKSVYKPQGDCLYCTDCQSDVCECKPNLSCEKLSLVVAGVFFAAALSLAIMAVYRCIVTGRKDGVVYFAELEESFDWVKENLGRLTCIPCFFSICLGSLGGGLLFMRWYLN